MGQEAKVRARIEGRETEGRLYLESDQLLFRDGDRRPAIAVADVKGARANGGTLALAVGHKQYVFDIGVAAQRWADRISNPRTLVQKLGVRPDSALAYVGARDAELLAELERAPTNVAKKRTPGDYDLIFVGIEKPADLDLLAGLDASIRSNGGVWVIFPKGRPDLKAEIIIPKARSSGLVDTKVARVSDRLTGMKFVIPVHLRK
jgi:hypothetical protein